MASKMFENIYLCAMEDFKRDKIEELIKHANRAPKGLVMTTKYYLNGFSHPDVRELRQDYEMMIKNYKYHSVAIMYVNDSLTIIFNVEHKKPKRNGSNFR